MRAFDGTPDKSLTGACVRAINFDYSCAIGRERNRVMSLVPRNADVERVIASPRPSCGGKSILDLIWEELMEGYRRLMPGGEHGDLEISDPVRTNTSGVVLGLASAIAIIINPYAPNVDVVRTEARARWEAEQ